MYIGLHVKYRYCRQILMKLEVSRQISEKYSNTKFHQNSCSGSRDVPCGQTDMTKLIVAFHTSANAPENASQYFVFLQRTVLQKALFRCCNQKGHFYFAGISRNFRFGVMGTTDVMRLKNTSWQLIWYTPHKRIFPEFYAHYCQTLCKNFVRNFSSCLST